MKIIGSVKEDLDTEKRISVTPETIKKFTDLNFSVLLEKNYFIMKVVSSLKSHKKRDLNSKLVRRRGRVYIINKKNPKFKTRQR